MPRIDEIEAIRIGLLAPEDFDKDDPGTSGPFDLCNQCYDDEACFGQDVDHPPYQEEEYNCDLCNKPLEQIDNTFSNPNYRAPKTMECSCGASEQVILDHPLVNTCEVCGRDYNMSGQLLAPRSQWFDEGHRNEDGSYESLSDITINMPGPPGSDLW
jgi:hypothetical protein